MITTELVEAQPRTAEQRGKNEARRVRATGSIPAVVYGAKKDSLSLAVDPKRIEKILNSEAGHNTIFDLQVGEAGGKEKVMIVDWQYDPIKGRLLHIDLKRIDMAQALQVSVPIVLTGTAEGVKTQGGILDQVLREVEVECLPGDIPSSFELDVTSLVFGLVLRVSDLPHTGKVKFVTPEDQAVAHITAVKEEEAPTPEAAAEAAVAAPAEPEVIKKGKQETAEEAPAEPAKKGEPAAKK
jgi:large subunit ribosomal protein L25